jgi:zinc transport system substrate-binding protein
MCVWLAALQVLSLGCSREPEPIQTPGLTSSEAERAEPPAVVVVNRPLYDFVRTLAGDAALVTLPVPAGIDPSHWTPAPEEIIAMQSADLILRNGAGYAAWLDRAALPRSRMVDTSVSFADRLIELTTETTHSHGDSGQHTHTDQAFTTWLDFDQARLQATIVEDALIRLLPDERASIQANAEVLRNDLRALDERMLRVAAQIGDTPLIVSHPVYHYWARRYNLNVQSVTWEPEMELDEFTLAELVSLRSDHPSSIMIWEGTPATANVERLSALGMMNAVFSPHSNPVPQDAVTFVERMNQNIDALVDTLGLRED